MGNKKIMEEGYLRKWIRKLAVCLVVLAYIAQMTGLFVRESVPLAEAKEVNKIYTFGSGEKLEYLKWKGTTENVIANPKSRVGKDVNSAFEPETMAFCLNRKGNPPTMGGNGYSYSRRLSKNEFSPIYYAYYSGKNYGLSGKKLWYATQVAIWCMLGQISSMRASGSPQLESLDYNGQSSDVLKAVKQLVKASEDEPVEPFESGSKIIRILGSPKVKIDEENQIATISGLSASVAGCEVSAVDSSKNEVKIQQDGKKLILKAHVSGAEELKITINASKPYMSIKGDAYYLGGGFQNIGYIGESINEKVSCKKNIKITQMAATPKGKIVIRKYAILDGEKTDRGLEGAIFSVKSDVYQNGEAIEVETNSEGIAEIENLPYGKYEITEIEAPKDFALENEDGEVNTTTVQLSEQQSEVSYNCYNRYLPDGILSIWKCDADDMSKGLTGARFVCRSVDGTIEKVVPPHHSVPGCYELKLPCGEYILTEEKAPEGYAIDPENCEWRFVLDDSWDGGSVSIAVDNTSVKRIVESTPIPEIEPTLCPISEPSIEPTQAPSTEIIPEPTPEIVIQTTPKMTLQSAPRITPKPTAVPNPKKVEEAAPPKTGDSTNFIGWGVLAAVSAVAFVCNYVASKKTLGYKK